MKGNHLYYGAMEFHQRRFHRHCHTIRTSPLSLGTANPTMHHIKITNHKSKPTPNTPTPLSIHDCAPERKPSQHRAVSEPGLDVISKTSSHHGPPSPFIIALLPSILNNIRAKSIIEGLYRIQSRSAVGLAVLNPLHPQIVDVIFGMITPSPLLGMRVKESLGNQRRRDWQGRQLDCYLLSVATTSMVEAEVFCGYLDFDLVRVSEVDMGLGRGLAFQSSGRVEGGNFFPWPR